jgi:hypothetical protein
MLRSRALLVYPPPTTTLQTMENSIPLPPSNSCIVT